MVSNKDFIKPTKEEFELLVKEVAERLKDVIYAEAEPQARRMLKELHFDRKIFNIVGDTYKFGFEINMVTGDFMQIISRKRRENG